MPGGFSFTGGQPRCFAFWQEFQKCYAGADHPSECAPKHEDYMECLHHKKEIARTAEIQSHYQAKQTRQLEEQKRDREAEVGGIFKLGLLRREREEKEAAAQKEKPASGGDDA